MSNTFRITMAQTNPCVGDLSANAQKAHAIWADARDANADFVAFPEMFLTGYQTQDMAMKPAFISDVITHVTTLAAECANGPALGIGGVFADQDKVYNTYYICYGGHIIRRIFKRCLPNISVFDEKRIYTPGPPAPPVSIGGVNIGFAICEDAWTQSVCQDLKQANADILMIVNGSPYAHQKHLVRKAQMQKRVMQTNLALGYLNLIGGQDDQVFDGGSFVLNPPQTPGTYDIPDTPDIHGDKMPTNGGDSPCPDKDACPRDAFKMPFFDEMITHIDFQNTPQGWRAMPASIAPDVTENELDYRACVEATRDYCAKSGFGKVLLGLSGGIDSALVATIAADALGPHNVRCVMLPSVYTSQHSLTDAKACADALGCPYEVLPITQCQQAVINTLDDAFAGTHPGISEENIQSRLRGVLLMALSNKFGHMLLTTGNKSEIAVGYATIYGDMSGGYNPIKDVYKTNVFALSRWRNTNHRPSWMRGPKGDVIAKRIIEKPPSAELRPDQKDEDSLPPYDILDGILKRLIDEDASIAECVGDGYDLHTVKRVENLIFTSEYKRFQSAPGPRISERAFWLDRRYPIINRWRDPSGNAL